MSVDSCWQCHSTRWTRNLVLPPLSLKTKWLKKKGFICHLVLLLKIWSILSCKIYCSYISSTQNLRKVYTLRNEFIDGWYVFGRLRWEHSSMYMIKKEAILEVCIWRWLGKMWQNVSEGLGRSLTMIWAHVITPIVIQGLMLLSLLSLLLLSLSGLEGEELDHNALFRLWSCRKLLNLWIPLEQGGLFRVIAFWYLFPWSNVCMLVKVLLSPVKMFNPGEI